MMVSANEGLDGTAMAIIFFDIDGTLAEGTHVPQSAANAVARTRAAGNLVFICTGRPRAYAENTFGAYADGFVCCNGRLAVRGGERVIGRPITQEQMTTILRVLDEFGVGYAFFGADGLYYGGNQKYRPISDQVHGPCGELDEALAEGEDLYSYDIFFAEAAERDAIAAALEGISLVNPHGPHPSADVTVAGYGKGDACLDVCRALGIDHADSYAFGDGVNDISMVEAVAYGVAMGNAVDELKKVAEFVTTDIHDDGVANGLAHFGLA